MLRTIELVRASEPFQHDPPQAQARVLVVGGSMAVGTGASTPARSVAGRLASDFPSVEIMNLAADGARIRDTIVQLIRATRGPYDLVLIQVGGTDIVRFTSSDVLKTQFALLLDEAAQKGKLVVLMPAGNVGVAPFFFAPISQAITDRARTLNQLAEAEAIHHGALFVNLFHEKESDPFLAAPERYFAADSLHPSDAGYALWYGELKRQGALEQILPLTAVARQ